MRWRRPSWVAWLLAVVLAGILGYALLAHSAGATARCYTAVLVSVERVIDGDTFDAQLSEAVWLGLYLDLRERVRVLGVDAWELHDPRGPAARDYTVAWLRDAGLVEVTACGRDHFGRLLGRVVSHEKGELAAALIRDGHGRSR